jgi:hypothetical protein
VGDGAGVRDGGGAVVLVTQNHEDLERVGRPRRRAAEGRVAYDGPVAGYRE